MEVIDWIVAVFAIVFLCWLMWVLPLQRKIRDNEYTIRSLERTCNRLERGSRFNSIEAKKSIYLVTGIRKAVKVAEADGNHNLLNIYLNGQAAGEQKAPSTANPFKYEQQMKYWAVWHEGWRQGRKLLIQKDRVRQCKLNFRKVRDRYHSLINCAVKVSSRGLKHLQKQ